MHQDEIGFEYPRLPSDDKEAYIHKYAKRRDFGRKIRDSLLNDYVLKRVVADGIFRGYESPWIESGDFSKQVNATYAQLLLLNSFDIDDLTLKTEVRPDKKSQKKAKEATVELFSAEQIKDLTDQLDWVLAQYEKRNSKIMDYTEIGRKNTFMYTQVFNLVMQARRAKPKLRLDIGKDNTEALKAYLSVSTFEEVDAARVKAYRLLDMLDKVAIESIRYFIDSAIIKKEFLNATTLKSKSCIGWGFTKDAARSLFHTFCVCDSFMALQDNIEGNDGRNIPKDEEFVKKIEREYFNDEQNIYERFTELVTEVGVSVWNDYKSVIKDSFFKEKYDFVLNSANLWEQRPILEKLQSQDLLDSEKTSELFNGLFLILITICASLNNILQDKEYAEYSNTVVSFLDRTNHIYKDAKAAGVEENISEYSVKYIYNTKESDEDIRRFCLMKKRNKDYFAAFIPVFVRTSNLASMYISRFPKKEMAEYTNYISLATKTFRQLGIKPPDAKDNRMSENEKAWLMEINGAIDLNITPKYYEALIDFYDYRKKFEEPFLSAERDEKQLKALVRSELESDLKEAHEKRVSDARTEGAITARNEIEALHKIERAITERINMLAKEAVWKQFVEILNAVTAYNYTKTNVTESGVASSELSFALQKALASNFAAIIGKTRGVKDSTNNAEIQNNFFSDILPKLSVLSEEILLKIDKLPQPDKRRVLLEELLEEIK